MNRRIRHLRLACVREEHARHGRVLLEDAMRTATFADEGRLIVVRRLDLGRIPLRASATQWSRRVEQAFRASQPVLVNFDHPRAEAADAVYFPNAQEPWIVLALRTAAGVPCRGWFWPRVLPGWNPGMPQAEALRLCVRALAAGAGLVATLQLATRLQAVQAFEPLLGSLQPEDLAAVRTELAAFAPPPTRRIEAGAVVLSRAPPPRLVQEWIRAWGIHDVRTQWLAAAHGLRRWPTPGGALSLVSVTTGRVREVLEEWSGFVRADDQISRTEQIARELTGEQGSRARAGTQAGTESRPHLQGDRLPPETRSPEMAPVDRLFTRAGGLFFMLPLLARAGFPEFLATLPDEERAAAPWHLLRLALTHARIATDDPAFALVDNLPPIETKLGRWLIGANRHARRLARLNLRQVIGRPALLSVTPTHVDLFFRPADADLRIRRAALDLDPGWVPWLGRAIAYHFNRED